MSRSFEVEKKTGLRRRRILVVVVGVAFAVGS